MNPKTFRLTSKSELLEKLSSYNSQWMFRGHGRASWRLTSTLERCLGTDNWNPKIAEVCERSALLRFESQAHHYLSRETLPQTKLGRISLMQHHGVPTRLLDFTTSPFIGLFFAFDGTATDQEEDCCIWALNYREVTKNSLDVLRRSAEDFRIEYEEAMSKQDEIFDAYISAGQVDVLWVTEPRVFNLRLERQKGTFLLSSSLRKPIEELLVEPASHDYVEKIVIPAALHGEVFKMLRSMGLDNSRLFGDIDGLAKDLKNEMQHHVETLQRSLREAGERAPQTNR